MAPKSAASGNCCTSRDPPSPDGLPPRPAISPLKSPVRAPRHLTPSWGTALSAQIGEELRAIFEGEKSDAGEESPKLKAKLTPKLKSLLGSDKLEPDDTSKANIKKTRSVKLKAILEGDDTDLDHMRCHTPRQSDNLTPLGAVKNKLKKVLSMDSKISRRQSRVSVGTSEEEVERRAELRRIRQKRIQDELSHEEFYDEDAKSSTSVVHPDSLLPMKSWKPWSPGEFLPLPELSPPALALPMYTFPTLRTPQARHDRLLQPGIHGLASPQLSPRPHSDTQIMLFSDIGSEMGTHSSGLRRHSSALLTEHTITPASELLVYKPTRKRSSFPLNILSHVPKPKGNNSDEVTAKSSWRSSFAAHNRGEHLRKLSLGKVVPVSLDPIHLGGDTQPVRRWLQNQRLRTSSQAITELEENPYNESLELRLGNAQDFGGVDGQGLSPEPLHLHEMKISQRLASHGLQSSSSSPQLSSRGSRKQRASNSGPSLRLALDRSRYLYHTSSDSISLSDRIPRCWGTEIQDGASTFYPSVGNSIAPTPESSRYNLLSLLAGKRNKTDPLPKNYSGLLKALTDPTFLPSTGHSTTSLVDLPNDYVCSHIVDDISLVLSETESFREIEAELLVVQQRFVATEIEQRPSSPRSSKFREQFDDQTNIPRALPTRNPSVISRLVKHVTRTFDGPVDMEELLAVPSLDLTSGALHHADDLLSPGNVISPLSDDNITSVWGNAVRLHANNKAKDVAGNLNILSSKSAWGRAVQKQTEPRAEEVADYLHIPGGTSQFGKAVQKKNTPKRARIARNLHMTLRKSRRDDGNLSPAVSDDSKSQASQDSRGGLSAAIKRVLTIRAGSKSPRLSTPGLPFEEGDRTAAAAEYEARFRKRIAAKELVLSSWEAELAAGAQKAKAKSREIVRKAKGKGRDPDDKRFPLSWSRWPSHSRPKRTQSAGREESVESRDFAIVGLTEEGEPIWCQRHERKHHLKHHEHHHRKVAEGSRSRGVAGDRYPSTHILTHSHDHSADANNATLGHPSIASPAPSRGRSLFRSISLNRSRSYRQSPSSFRSVQSRLQGFEESFRTALYKFETSGEQGLADQVHGRRSSLNLEGRMEFPELEILPMTEGIVSQVELERKINRQIMGERRAARVQFVRRGSVGVEGMSDVERLSVEVGGERGIGADGEGEDQVGDGGECEHGLRTSASSCLSIADPRFYDDCIDCSLLLDGEEEKEDEDGGIENSDEDKYGNGVNRDGAEGYREDVVFTVECLASRASVPVSEMVGERQNMRRESFESTGIYEDARDGEGTENDGDTREGRDAGEDEDARELGSDKEDGDTWSRQEMVEQERIGEEDTIKPRRRERR